MSPVKVLPALLRLTTPAPMVSATAPGGVAPLNNPLMFFWPRPVRLSELVPRFTLPLTVKAVPASATFQVCEAPNA